MPTPTSVSVTLNFATHQEAIDALALLGLDEGDTPSAEKPNSGKPRGRPRKDAAAPEGATPAAAAPAPAAPAAVPAPAASAPPAPAAAPPADVQAAYRTMAEALTGLMEADYDGCKALLQSFGAGTAKDLKPEQYAAVTEAAKAKLAPPSRASLI